MLGFTLFSTNLLYGYFYVQKKKPKDPTIREKFDTYRFADYKEKVIDLLLRVTTVSVRTQGIVGAMRVGKR